MEDQDYLWFLLLLIPVLALIWCWCQGQKPAQPVQHKLAPVYVPQAPPVQLAPAPPGRPRIIMLTGGMGAGKPTATADPYPYPDPNPDPNADPHHEPNLILP